MGRNNRHKPNALWNILMIVLIVVELVLMSRATMGGNLAAAFIGCIAGVIVLGFGRANNLTRFMNSGGRYTEWSPFGADQILTGSSIAAWVVGMVNFYFVALELSR